MTVAMTEQKQELSLSSEHVDEMPVKAEEAISNGLGMTDEQYDANEKSLVRKLDFTLLPMVWLLYFFNYLDRNNIAQARLSSFEQDLGLKGNQFNVAVSILNVGYMLMQLPSNMLLTRTRPSMYIPAWTALWSIVSAATAGAGTYTHLIVIRFFLGIAEAPFFPGIACTDGQPRSNEHLIFYLKERRESVSYTHVQSADRLGSRMLPVS
ncbi:hypothetical protein BFJ63_vAg9839 [Fusarium oxysporum f. sp. narcissi]|uniref:Major facilitator superfamily (MFS) profile domain-containing protein n=1 Tax=Fusarium oxysporum f. sp. narcissi TaxID=451672 RepID=A0A4Q2VLW9_FUSOX|nr:hypothetical protein BFJ63_vAg9839 [Fusarium oxysporum f. sp. narcissi]